MTTINPPTKAVERAVQAQDWSVVVVGDNKTPTGWTHPSVRYLSPADQGTLPYQIGAHLPWNIPARVMMGFLYAIKHGAQTILQLDDDNILYEGWKMPPFNGMYTQVSSTGFVNIYKNFTNAFVWPRGYPLNKILSDPSATERKTLCRVGIWQHLADGDTDVDAIYRLTNGKEITFEKKSPRVLAAGTVCPFNCQSTTYIKEVFPLLYLPGYITPRASDIMRGIVAQPALWAAGYTLGFTAPTVYQERNPHDYLKDFEAELLIYLHVEKIYHIAKKAVSRDSTVSENLLAAYSSLVHKGLVPPEELPLVTAWVKDVESLTH